LDIGELVLDGDRWLLSGVLSSLSNATPAHVVSINQSLSANRTAGPSQSTYDASSLMSQSAAAGARAAVGPAVPATPPSTAAGVETGTVVMSSPPFAGEGTCKMDSASRAARRSYWLVLLVIVPCVVVLAADRYLRSATGDLHAIVHRMASFTRAVEPARCQTEMERAAEDDEVARWTHARERAWNARMDYLEKELLTYRHNLSQAAEALQSTVMENRKLRTVIKKGSTPSSSPVVPHRVGVVSLASSSILCSHVEQINLDECANVEPPRRISFFLQRAAASDGECPALQGNSACQWHSLPSAAIGASVAALCADHELSSLLVKNDNSYHLYCDLTHIVSGPREGRAALPDMAYACSGCGHGVGASFKWDRGCGRLCTNSKGCGGSCSPPLVH